MFFTLNIRDGFSVFRNTSIESWLSYGDGVSNNKLGYLLINFGMVFMFMLHEMGHILAGIRFGIQPQNLSFVLYFGLFPMFYVKNKNIYSLRRKEI